MSLHLIMLASSRVLRSLAELEECPRFLSLLHLLLTQETGTGMAPTEISSHSRRVVPFTKPRWIVLGDASAGTTGQQSSASVLSAFRNLQSISLGHPMIS